MHEWQGRLLNKELWTPTAATLLGDWKRKMSSTPEEWPFLWETTSNWRIIPGSLRSPIRCGLFKERDPSAVLFLSLRSEGWCEYMHYGCRKINDDCSLFPKQVPDSAPFPKEDSLISVSISAKTYFEDITHTHNFNWRSDIHKIK